MHPHRHVRSRLGRQGNLPVDPGRSTPSIALSHLSHTDQRVRPGTQHQFLQRPDRGPVLFPRRLKDPAPQPRYVFLMDAPIHDAPIKNALRSVHLYGVQLALPVRTALGFGLPNARLPTSAPLRPQPPPLVSDRFPMITAQEERRHHDHKSRCLSAIGLRFLSILFPPRNSAPLTIGLPAPKSRTPTGFPRSTHTRYDRGGRPLYPETSGVRATGLWPPVAACRHCQRPGPITRVLHPSSRASNNEASSRVHSHSPVRSSPRPVAPPDGTGVLGLLP